MKENGMLFISDGEFILCRLKKFKQFLVCVVALVSCNLVLGYE